MAKKRTDKTRASRDGHEFHEAWTARKALQLFWPNSDLVGISVEGLSPVDQSRASQAAVEIADISLYFGSVPSFERGARQTIAQFKYSIADKDNDFRASHAKMTIKKFARTYTEYTERYGARNVSERLDFQLVTNQPVYKPMIEAIEAIANGLSRTAEVKKQGDQFIAAAGLTGKHLAEFAARVRVIGRSGSLRATKDELENLLVDWSATMDPIAGRRLGRLRELVRDKAGDAGTGNNLITRQDLLAALGVGDADDLLPCKSRLVDVGPVVEREQLSEALQRIEKATLPVLIHAAGGVGKTVFMKSLERKLQETSEVVFFDCFGGGAYRALDDARHQPKQGLVHIANTLSFRGLCDPMLPESQDQQSLMRTFKRRLAQCVATMSRVMPGRRLVLLIDAIDNAEIAARRRSEDPFPVRLLEALDNEPIDNVNVIVSCRSHRKPTTYAKYDAYELRPFSRGETRTFLRARLEGATETETKVAQARSGGNPRVLEYLLLSGRGLLDTSEIFKPLALDDLIQQQITDALETAKQRGYEQDELDLFLAGLAVLPPPVPFDEYAGAHGIEPSAVESFASDMAPLLERTNQGLTFKDEPTETLVRERYASSKEPLRRVADNLLARQDQSVYAARALPGLLHEIDDADRLFALAFDDRIPASVTSTVGKRNIRNARLKAATLHAALKSDYDRLVRLLVELSTIAVVDQRGARYIHDHPDLAAAAHDEDALRRLFETRSGWPGARHARLVIANALTGDSEEAHRHAIAAQEWIEHARRKKDDGRREEGPERQDIAAIPFFLIAHGRVEDAAAYLCGWYDWYAFEVCEHIFDYSRHAQAIGAQSGRRIEAFVDSLTALGQIAAALSFCRLSKAKTGKLIQKLARRCSANTDLRLSGAFTRDRVYDIEDGLRKSSALALAFGLTKEALKISARARHDRPGLWAFRGSFHTGDIFRFIYRRALVAAARGTEIHEADLLPRELASICARIPKRMTGKAFRDIAKERLSKIPRTPRDGDEAPAHPHAMSHEENQNAAHFIDDLLQPLLELTMALSGALGASTRQIDKRFVRLIDAWENTRKANDSYRGRNTDSFFQPLGLEVAQFILWTRDDLKAPSVRRFLAVVHARANGPSNLIRIVEILARRGPLRAVAGAQAVAARTLIQTEGDVTDRAAYFSHLARAMLPASTDEATNYFREGLEQMDAIGSGDHEFTNELLIFASSIRGEELGERDFHTLSNIAELNLGDEPQKFFWGAYGRGLARVAGLRGLAKLSRWDDRSQIALANTLLPYLIGLLKYGKIAPCDALALNRLAAPVEYFYSSTEEFADAIREQAGPDPIIISALIEQYRDNNPGTWSASTTAKLCTLAEEAFGRSSDSARFLAAAGALNARISDTINEGQNCSRGADAQLKRRKREDERLGRAAINRIANRTDPADEGSLTQAISDFNGLESTYSDKDRFFAALRTKVDYEKRGDYIRNVCALQHLFYHWKVAELKQAKAAWANSSASLDAVFKSQAIPLINLHADDLISYGRVSESNIKEISDLTGVPVASLVLEPIKVFARPGRDVPGAAWLAFASIICPQADDGRGQAALSRLLGSDVAKLANNVPDGGWMNGLYPSSDISEIGAGLVWRALGSPDAVSRWRAGHCMRDFAAFGSWSVIDAVVKKLNATTGGPFQAAELKFYFMHAKLWLLITLARLALDYPDQVARYSEELLGIVTERNEPHVLTRHFAAQALLACVGGGALQLTTRMLETVSNANDPSRGRLKKTIGLGDDFYRGRPKGAPGAQFEFHLDYDFHKYDVCNLGYVFGKSCWEVADMMSEIVHAIDPEITSMHQLGGREPRFGRASLGLGSRLHGYGQQLGWHALFLSAGRLLESCPVTDDSGHAEPWREWLGRYTLTRRDGLWLSDGTDRTPLDACEVLLEHNEKGFAVPGDRERLLSLAGITGPRLGKELLVEGRWLSADHIQVEISSALVSPAHAAQVARGLLREEPMIAWLPVFHETEDDDEYLHSDIEHYAPWVVSPYREARLDEYDPYGVSGANCRPRLARDYAFLCGLACDDPFCRTWHNTRGILCLRAQAWGRDEGDREEGPHPGRRLFCRSSVIKKVLSNYDRDLLLLIKLQRYEKQVQGDSHYTHSVAAVRVNKMLDVEYFQGKTNYSHKPRY